MGDFRLNELKVEVTYKCPLACVHCSSDANEENETSISKEKCFEIIQDATSLGATEISFSGGEPLVWDGIFEAVALASSLGLNTNVYTSGNVNDSLDVFSCLKASGLQKAIFSIYSADKAEHNRITRKRDSYDNTLKSVIAAHKNGITVEIHFVALASNYKNLTSIVELAKSLNVNKISVLRFVPQGRGVNISKRDTMSKAQNLELIKMITSIRQSGFNIRTGSPFNVLFLNEHPKCMAAQDRLIINPNLCVFPCDAFKQISAADVSAEVKDSDLVGCTLQKAWVTSSYLNTVRHAILSEPTMPCKTCSSYSKCLSGCLAQKFLHHGSLFKNPDPACIIRR